MNAKSGSHVTLHQPGVDMPSAILRRDRNRCVVNSVDPPAEKRLALDDHVTSYVIETCLIRRASTSISQPGPRLIERANIVADGRKSRPRADVSPREAILCERRDHGRNYLMDYENRSVPGPRQNTHSRLIKSAPRIFDCVRGRGAD